MDKRILTILMALGVSPAVIAEEANKTETKDKEVKVSFKELMLHLETKFIFDQLKAMEAVSVTKEGDDTKLVIHGEKLSDSFYEFLSKKKKVTVVEDSDDLVVSDDLAAALAKFGDLKSLPEVNEDEELLKELQKKMGTKLDKALRLHSGASFG